MAIPTQFARATARLGPDAAVRSPFALTVVYAEPMPRIAVPGEPPATIDAEKANAQLLMRFADGAAAFSAALTWAEAVSGSWCGVVSPDGGPVREVTSLLREPVKIEKLSGHERIAAVLSLFHRLGVKRQRKERFASLLRAAVARLDEVAEIAWVHLELGQAQATIGALPEAELSLSRALELAVEGRAEAHAARASCRLRRERYADAEADAQAVVELASDAAIGYRMLGDVLRASDRHAAAIDAYGEAISRSAMADEEHRLARFRRAECHAELGQHAEAVADYSALLDTGFRQRARLGRARSYEALGQLREALADWEHAREGGAREANAAIVQIRTALAIGGSLRPHEGESGVRAGDRVQHAKFGAGLVLEVDDQGEQPRAVVRFDDDAAGEKALLLRFLRPL